MLRIIRDRIGVIVTDHLMPGYSGYEGLEVVFRAKPLPPPELIELVRSSLAEANRHRGAA